MIIIIVSYFVQDFINNLAINIQKNFIFIRWFIIKQFLLMAIIIIIMVILFNNH